MDSTDAFYESLLAGKDITSCPLASAARIVQGKWSMVVIALLMGRTLRFSEIKRLLPQVTDANLTKELRALEAAGIVHREVYPVVPPKVEYSLTEKGDAFKPVIEAIASWAGAFGTGSNAPQRTTSSSN